MSAPEHLPQVEHPDLRPRRRPELARHAEPKEAPAKFSHERAISAETPKQFRAPPDTRTVPSLAPVRAPATVPEFTLVGVARHPAPGADAPALQSLDVRLTGCHAVHGAHEESSRGDADQTPDAAHERPRVQPLRRLLERVVYVQLTSLEHRVRPREQSAAKRVDAAHLRQVLEGTAPLAGDVDGPPAVRGAVEQGVHERAVPVRVRLGARHRPR